MIVRNYIPSRTIILFQKKKRASDYAAAAIEMRKAAKNLGETWYADSYVAKKYVNKFGQLIDASFRPIFST